MEMIKAPSWKDLSLKQKIYVAGISARRIAKETELWEQQVYLVLNGKTKLPRCMIHSQVVNAAHRLLREKGYEI